MQHGGGAATATRSHEAASSGLHNASSEQSSPACGVRGTPRLQVQWSHIDIAGPAWRDKDGGATGFGAQLLAEWAAAQGR